MPTTTPHLPRQVSPSRRRRLFQLLAMTPRELAERGYAPNAMIWFRATMRDIPEDYHDRPLRRKGILRPYREAVPAISRALELVRHNMKMLRDERWPKDLPDLADLDAWYTFHIVCERMGWPRSFANEFFNLAVELDRRRRALEEGAAIG